MVSLAVNSTKPSPDARLCTDTAPAFPQAAAAVLVRLLAFALTPTSDVHTTGVGGPGGAESSLTIVPVAVARPSVAFTGADSVTVNASSASSVMSPTMDTAMVRDDTPGEKVSVPEAVA